VQRGVRVADGPPPEAHDECGDPVLTSSNPLPSAERCPSATIVGMADDGHVLGSHASPATAAAFYDDLAASYHRLYPDWDVAVREQAAALDRVLRHLLGAGPHRVLDCAVGIGTQALGLSALGHRVSGTDLSDGALRRARAEATDRGLTVSLTAADMRHLPFAGGELDAVVCIDALAHLPSLAEATRALREMARVVRPGGVVLVSIRDYEAARRDRLPGTLPQVSRTPTDEAIAFQVWDWHADGKSYDLTHFGLASRGGGWVVTTRAATLRAFVRDELLGVARSAGLVDVGWRTAPETGFFQPLLVARTPGSSGPRGAPTGRRRLEVGTTREGP
jgi:SAM-dependent methyltransferase